MKDILNYINENKTDNAIEAALNVMNTSEDIEALGEAFGKKYENNVLSALVEFLDGLEVVVKDDNAQKTIIKLRNEINK